MVLTAAQNAAYQYTKTVAQTAYIYGYSLISLWILMSVDVNTKAPFNQMYYSTGLTTPTYGPFKGPNSDALYATAWLDLTNTPILLTTPDTRQQNRWWTVQLLDIYSNTFSNVPGLDKNKPSKQYFIVGPDWDDEDYCLPNNAKLIKAPSNVVYLVSRTEVKDRDVASALVVMHGITLSPVIPSAATLLVTPITNSTSLFTSLDYFSLLSQILNYNSPLDDEACLLDTFSTVGLSSSSPFLPSSLSPHVSQAFFDSIDVARSQIIAYGYQYATGLVSAAQWQGGTKNGAFGNDYLRRAYASYTGPAANIPQEQFYITTILDASNTVFNGSVSNYKLHFPPDTFPDVNKKWGFWSLTVYTVPSLQLYPNSIDRYALGSHNHDLVYNQDGSLDLYLQNSQPSSSIPHSNWLPCPAASFRLIFRMYSASDSQIKSPSNLPCVDPF